MDALNNAAPNDEILINYEDIPLMYYLPNPIRGGISAFRVEDDRTNLRRRGPRHALLARFDIKDPGDVVLASGHGYYCFCTKEELEQRRAAAQAESRPPRYEGTCRRLPRQEAEKRRREGAPSAVRFAVPLTGVTAFDDQVFGRVEFANTELEDFVLLRSDGVPTYHLSVVTDDIDMRMTHILRGADHISNTPKQVLLYQALGAAIPVR